MTIEKLGVQPEVQHVGLRQEEARLMGQMQRIMSQGESFDGEMNKVNAELGEVRARLTELDLAKDLPG